MRGARAILGIALLLLVATPGALAQAPTFSRVRLESAGDVWNGETTVAGAEGPVDLWIPPNARLHDVTAATPQGNVTVPWRAQDTDLVRAQAPANATSLAVTYDFRASPYLLASVRVATPRLINQIEILPPEGQAVTSDDATFEPQPDGVWRAVLPAPTSATVRVHVVDADRVGELPIVLTVALVAALSFGLVLLWHRIRPPLQGRAPEKFLDHLAELQQRLLPPVLVFAFLNFWYFASGLRLVHWNGYTLVAPTFSVEGSLASRAFEAFAERLVPAGVQLVVLRPADAVLAQVQMTLFLATLSVVPILLYELALFVGPALKPRERRIATRSVPLVLALLLAGATFGYLVMAPLMIRTLYDFAPATGATPLLVIGDLLSFSLVVILAFALAFELPVLMYVTSRLGLVHAKTYRHYLRHAIIAIVVIAGIVTPDPSIVSQLLVAAPVTTLYVVGMGAALMAERRRARAKDARTSVA